MGGTLRVAAEVVLWPPHSILNTFVHTHTPTHTKLHTYKHAQNQTQNIFIIYYPQNWKPHLERQVCHVAKMVMCAFLNFQWGWVFWDQNSQWICEPLAGSFINVDSDRWREWNVCKNCTHLRLFDLFEINLRVSTTWNAKHMSLILNLIQHMEMFIRIRTLQTQSRR